MTDVTKTTSATPNVRARFNAAMTAIDDPLRHLPEVARVMGCPAGTSTEEFLISRGLAEHDRYGRLTLVPDQDRRAQRAEG